MMTGVQEDIKKDGGAPDGDEDAVKIEGTFNGLPYKGPMIYIKHTDREERLPQLIKKLHVKRFDLGEPKDLEDYEKTCQSLTDGQAQLSVEKIEYVPDKTKWIVLMRWIEMWYGPPKE